MPIAHLTDRAVLHVGGAEARPFLQGLLTNDLDQLSPERPLWAALLTPQGKVLFDLLLYDDGEGGVSADVEAARTDDFARRLTMYRLRRAVTIAVTELTVTASWGDAGLCIGLADPRTPMLGARTIGAVVSATTSLTQYRAHRLGLGVAEGATELGIDKTLWLEANAAELNGVSFTKGCYVGQENTARMHYRSNVRRRLLPIVLTAAPGEDRSILSGTNAAGELRAWEGSNGLGHLRLDYADGPLTLEGAPVRVNWPAWLHKPDTAPVQD